MGVLAKMVTNEKDEEEKNKLLEMIERASSNAMHLVKDVLEMAELEQGGASIKLQPVAILPLITEVVKLQTSTAERKDIQVKLNHTDVLYTVLADPTYTRQVIENLVSNALKFSPAGKDIEVSIIDNDSHIQIHVRDSGPGVPKGEEHRLFKKFSRLSAQPTGGESSSGLGLSLVKRYMELMNGSVRYESAIDRGAIFVVEFMKVNV
jgi:signal transduction histidine kinase